MHKKASGLFVLGVLLTILTGCGATTTSSSSFKVRMHGVYSPPVGADGNSTPRSQTYLLKGVTLNKSDGTTLPLYSGDGDALKIIDRGQLIFTEDDTSDHDGTVISSVLLQFDPIVLVTSKNGKESSVELSSGDMQLDEPFTITKNKERVLTIKIAWGDTITINDDGTETIAPPTFTLKYESAD